jgi:hypothetical protein
MSLNMETANRTGNPTERSISAVSVAANAIADGPGHKRVTASLQ